MFHAQNKILLILFITAGLDAYADYDEELNFHEYMDPDYIYTTVYETQNVLLSDVKEIITAKSLTTLDSTKVKDAGLKLEELAERFTNIATAKLRIDPKNAASEACNFFQLGVKTRVVIGSIDDVYQCIIASCPKDTQSVIVETLFLKMAELDNPNKSCLDFLSQENR